LLELGDATEVCATLVVDETPLSSWDIQGNPSSDALSGEGGELIFQGVNGSPDYVCVLTQAPMRHGVHFFEFVLHEVNDEQWCGVVTDPTRAGHSCGESIYYKASEDIFKPGWFYYCGRRVDSGSLCDGDAALHLGWERNGVKKAARVIKGSVIGLLIDVDEGAVVFMHNGEIQGACEVPKVPLYVSTCPDRPGDRVELRKLSPADAGPAALAALKGPLITAEVYNGGSDLGLLVRPPNDETSSESLAAC